MSLFDDEEELAPRRKENWPRGWALLPAMVGLLIGAAIGLALAWGLFPAQYGQVAPSLLNEQEQAGYRRLIALAYHANGDLQRAQQRLSLLEDEDPAAALSAQAQQALASGEALADARALADLAAALRMQGALAGNTQPTSSQVLVSPSLQPTGVTAVSSPTPRTETQDATSPTAPARPTGTPAPRATATLRPTLPVTFQLLSSEQVCDPDAPADTLQVEVLSANGSPLSGVELRVSWEGGENIFYTGLYPELSPGYADFHMQPGIKYSLSAGQGGISVSDLGLPDCENGGWRVVFGQ